MLIVAAARVRVAHPSEGRASRGGSLGQPAGATARGRDRSLGGGRQGQRHGLSAQRQRYDHAYFANGVSKSNETFKLGAANAQGISAITGSGKRISGGTSVHKNEKCSYTFTGS